MTWCFFQTGSIANVPRPNGTITHPKPSDEANSISSKHTHVKKRCRVDARSSQGDVFGDCIAAPNPLPKLAAFTTQYHHKNVFVAVVTDDTARHRRHHRLVLSTVIRNSVALARTLGLKSSFAVATRHVARSLSVCRRVSPVRNRGTVGRISWRK